MKTQKKGASAAPAPAAKGTPQQDQKGMGGNDAPPNKPSNLTASGKKRMEPTKQTVGRTVSQPQMRAASRGAEPAAASQGGREMPSQAGEFQQPITADVVPLADGAGQMGGGMEAEAMGGDPMGGAPMGGEQITPQGAQSMLAQLVQEMLMMAMMQQQGGGGGMPMQPGMPQEAEMQMQPMMG